MLVQEYRHDLKTGVNELVREYDDGNACGGSSV